MHVSSFVNNVDPESLHTNQYAAGSVNTRSFNDRRAVDSRRQIIRSYRDSQLGRQPLARERTVKPLDRVSSAAADKLSSTNRQEMNAQQEGVAPKRTFQEPVSRGYDPYK